MMLKIYHQLHKTKRDGARIEKWLHASLDIPSQHCHVPDLKWIKEFKQWVWEHEDSKVLMHPFTSTKDLATLCCDEWLELQTISAFMAIINNSTNRRKAMTFSNLVELNDNELKSVMATELKNVDEIALILHVGKNTWNSYISSRNLPGNH